MSASTFADFGILIRPTGPVEQRLPCPQCDRGSRDDALGVNVETGTFHCFRCGWAGHADIGETRAASVTRLDEPNRAERVKERLRRVWADTLPLDHPKARPVRQYLAARGLTQILQDAPACLRAHPGLAYFDGVARREIGTFPAMVAAFFGRDGGHTTIHATYLRQDGCAKAPVSSPKKILGVPTRGATKGGAIRLYAPRDGLLGVAEGIETALSLYLIRRVPTWASFCADNLARMVVPEGLTKLEIGVDVDESGAGERAAKSLARRAVRLGLKVSLITPEGDGPRDLNDELRRRAG